MNSEQSTRVYLHQIKMKDCMKNELKGQQTCKTNLAEASVKNEQPDRQKIWKKIAKCLCSFASRFFSNLNFDNSKPRFFAYLVRVLTSFISISEESSKQRLQESLTEVLKELCNNTEFWKASDRLKRFNTASQSICGRKALASLKHLLSILEP
ncbi:unnamed protein product [Brugia timori]|uniref:Uncharacterized protein n=1 Tax=Brugia timori TaxID=42155 RepID=A0A3P7WC96_9BILA|nr:unnamed protein product [Brugia timori]